MYNEFATYMKGKDMLLIIEKTYPSDVGMLGTDESDEQVQCYAAESKSEKIRLMADVHGY
jgi:hypothetical protein